MGEICEVICETSVERNSYVVNKSPFRNIMMWEDVPGVMCKQKC